ncbi:helix-turn-helix domain-containing protein [Veillonella magna]|uniref:helix-turn-helix domain-containing protein n=1 Tax=Veillonella magna TaxID=464322 RepID=UPI0023F38753|nr:helix-turn-helix transcriptional regulator [Veillonella magna]
MVKRIDSNSNKEILFRQIGAKITYYRKAQQLTQEQLAVRVNVSTNTIGRIERGKYNNNISLSLLLDIAVGLGIEAYVLLMFTEEEKRVWHGDD